MRIIWRRLFTEHPASIGESYAEHARQAAAFAISMLGGAVACFLHAVVPALCTTTGSRIIARLHDRMTLNRVKGKVDCSNVSLPSCDFLAEHI
jgi:Family of unknown function (DUF6356)